MKNKVTNKVTLKSQIRCIPVISEINKAPANVTLKSAKRGRFCDFIVTNTPLKHLIINTKSVTLKTIRRPFLLSHLLFRQLGQRTARLVPTPYPLYIKSNIQCLSGLLTFDSPFVATANHPYAMDRRKRDFRLKALGYRY